MNRITRLALAAAAGGLLVAGQLAVVAAPAAALPGYTIVKATSPSNPNDKEVTANCPAGRVTVGAAAQVGGGGGYVHIDAVVPTQDRVTVHASHYPGPGGFGNWTLTATAVCAFQPAGYQIVSAESVPSGDPEGDIDVTCPVGKKLIAIGGRIGNADGDVVLTGIVPNLNLTKVTVAGAQGFAGAAPEWNAVAYGVCINPPAGLSRFLATSVLDSTGSKWTSPGCPAGRSVHGTGFETAGPPGRILYRITDLHQTSVRTGAGEDLVTTPDVWQLTGYVICAV